MKKTILIILTACFAVVQSSIAQKRVIPDNRVVVLMLDGFGLEYLQKSDMPVLQEKIIKRGFYKAVKAMIPSLTNCNNASICCGVAASEHGVVGNTFLNTVTGKTEYLERGDLVMAPTIFERAKKHNIKSALFSSKLKTIPLLSRGADLAVCPETASPEWTSIAGKVPGKYSREVNYWTLTCAIHTLRNQPDIKLLYIHTTDYAMHTWAPESKESMEHLHKIDSLIGEILAAAPDASVFITADHGMNKKTRVWDLEQALENRGLSIETCISPLADKYPKHHSGYGGIAYVYLKSRSDLEQAKKELHTLEGVEEVYTREEAAKRFMLMPERIGDLVILGDKETVFGSLEEGEKKALPANYRTHGSKYEQDVPLIIYNIDPIPDSSFFKHNKDIVSWLY